MKPTTSFTIWITAPETLGLKIAETVGNRAEQNIGISTWRYW